MRKQKKNRTIMNLFGLYWLGILTIPNVLAQQGSDSIDMEYILSLDLEALTNIEIDLGSRAANHNSWKSPVPVDVITENQLERTGFTELSQVLQRFLPSFNFPRPSIVDGTDHARPFTLSQL